MTLSSTPAPFAARRPSSRAQLLAGRHHLLEFHRLVSSLDRCPHNFDTPLEVGKPAWVRLAGLKPERFYRGTRLRGEGFGTHGQAHGTPRRAAPNERAERYDDLPTWRRTTPRANPDIHRGDLERSTERLEMLLGTSAANRRPPRRGPGRGRSGPSRIRPGTRTRSPSAARIRRRWRRRARVYGQHEHRVAEIAELRRVEPTPRVVPLVPVAAEPFDAR